MGEQVRGAVLDRRQEILSGAAEVFSEFGYHRARMSQIAGSSGITGPALYRHFPGKEALLAAVVDAGTGIVDDLFEKAAAEGGDPADLLSRTLCGLARAAVEYRYFGIILQRDARHLPEPDRARTGARWTVLVEELGNRIRAVRTELAPADAEFLGRAMLAVAASPSTYRVRGVTDARRRRALTAMLTSAGRADVGVTGSGGPRRPRAPDIATLADRASRREAIIGVSNRLFRLRGFHGVSIEDIADAAGVTGPTVYSYFDSKADLLATSCHRGVAWLELEVENVLVTEQAPAGRLDGVLRSLVTFALRHGDTMAMLVREVPNLPPDGVRTARRDRVDHTAEVVRLVRAERPGLDEPTARILVRGSVAVVNELACADRYRDRPDLERELGDIALCTLRADP
ncbi:TetR/AcrR family transcriptional regulator [Pseudonocardia sp. KRD291]|uniref:TetR/AcrR family transcriptional regulator n=1 Tax=Pseudonocardia sp. KRD291 TaxID=2792007 RepID=UPI001C4A2011|nr:TetR/AcrR family transcriptional regulator [Pseudonocardia sp. KRD291]MBW0106764.1 TetR/AcrR family transcriptional regulator [Pseudonocardia sp. KRD291]